MRKARKKVEKRKKRKKLKSGNGKSNLNVNWMIHEHYSGGKKRRKRTESNGTSWSTKVLSLHLRMSPYLKISNFSMTERKCNLVLKLRKLQVFTQKCWTTITPQKMLSTRTFSTIGKNVMY